MSLPPSPETHEDHLISRHGESIHEFEQDELGRGPFAAALAQALRQQPKDKALVLAICGDWGSGKSSVLNLVKRALETQEVGEGEGLPLWLPFNPWQWSGADVLVNEFFDTLTPAVEKLLAPDPEPEPQQPWLKPWWRLKKWRGNRQSRRATLTAERLQLYGARLKVHSVFVEGYQSLMTGVVGLLALLAGAGYIAKSETVTLLVAVPGGIFAGVSAFTKWGADITEKLASSLEAQKKASARSPRATKEELVEKLKALPRPILVVMDDSDRLTAAEVTAVFQLVKAQADSPNVFYLLAFSRKIVESSLERVAPGVPGNGLPEGAGREFLEKIVPTMFDLPSIDERDIERLLRIDIEKTLNFSLAVSPVTERWNDLWSCGLASFFETVRDTERFVNGLAFGKQLLGGDELEVDALDLIVVETLRLFEPTFYAALAQSRGFFTGQSLFDGVAESYIATRYPRPDGKPARDPKAERHQAVLVMLERVSAPHRDVTRQLLRRLFTGADDILRIGGDSSVPHYEDVRRRAPRIADEQFFSRFFRYALGPDEWSQAEVKVLLDKTPDRTRFTAHLRDVSEGKLAPRNSRPTRESSITVGPRRLADLLELTNRRICRSEELDKDYVHSLVLDLFEAGDALPDTLTGQWSHRTLPEELGDLAHSALIGIKSRQVRDSVLMATLRETTSYAVPAHFVLAEHHRQDENDSASGTESQALLSALQCLLPSNLEMAKDLALQKIEAAAKDDRFWREPRLKHFLYLWEEWGDDEAKSRLGKILSELTSTNEGVLRLLQGFLMASISSTIGDGPTRSSQTWDISPSELDHFGVLAPVRTALPALNQQLEEELRELRSDADFELAFSTEKRRWLAIYLTGQMMAQFDQNRYRDMRGLYEHKIIYELKQIGHSFERN